MERQSKPLLGPFHPPVQRPQKQGWKNQRHGTFTGGHRTHPTCCFPVVAADSTPLTRGATRIGIALADSIDELLREEAITPQLAQTIMVQVCMALIGRIARATRTAEC